jgi:5'-nucleotidase
MAARVLVVNDDGIDAPGLHAIVDALARDGVVVCVAAPTSERSATGHGISIHAPLVAVPVAVPHAVESFAVSGLPADCTMLALGPLFAHLPPFDLVVSGINRGNNYGCVVLFFPCPRPSPSCPSGVAGSSAWISRLACTC